MNVLDFAMQMELDGKAHYESLEQDTPVPGLRKIFSILAADEQKHYDVVDAMQSGVTPEMADSTALEEAKNIFQTLEMFFASSRAVESAISGVTPLFMA